VRTGNRDKQNVYTVRIALNLPSLLRTGTSRIGHPAPQVPDGKTGINQHRQTLIDRIHNKTPFKLGLFNELSMIKLPYSQKVKGVSDFFSRFKKDTMVP